MQETSTSRVVAAALQRHGIPDTIPSLAHANLVELFQHATERFSTQPAFSSLGHTLSYGELRDRAHRFTRYLQQHTDLQPGDRIAIQMPNLVQYPVVLFGALQAGLVVVNTNPLYTPRELAHQLQDSGAKAAVVLANVAGGLQQVIADTAVEQVILTEVADLHPPLKRWLINSAVRYGKRSLPRLNFDRAMSLRQALDLGGSGDIVVPPLQSSDMAVLQYTGGTTGTAKGAVLSHANLLANVVQSRMMLEVGYQGQGPETMVMPLPLYHIYSFLNSLLMLEGGHHSVLIPDPRDTAGLVKTLQKYPVSHFVGITTLFVSLCRNQAFRQLDFSGLNLTLAGGMALTQHAADEWLRVTGTEINQGYGLTETSPVVAVNPRGANQLGTIGMVVPGTDIRIVDAAGQALAVGEAGELCVRGPQVMQGYWQRPEATAEVLDSEGWFATGDIAVVQPDGYIRIVDRKKDMILVSGFNVYPNELEDVVSSHPAVVESAAIGVPDEHSGEAIKMFVVASQPVSADELQRYCRERLTGYKVPRQFEFVDQLPKSNVGKVLRKELR